MKYIFQVLLLVAFLTAVGLIVVAATHRGCSGTVQYNNGHVIRVHKSVAAVFCDVPVTKDNTGCESGDQYPQCGGH